MAKKAYRYIIISVLIVAAFLGLFAGINYVLHLNRYVIKVNGQGVPIEELKVYMNIVKKQKEKLAGITGAEEIKKFWTEPVDGIAPVVFVRQEALNSIINLMLIAQKANEKGIQSSRIDESLLREKLNTQGFIKELQDMGVEERYIQKIINSLSLKLKLFNNLTQNITLTDAEFEKILSDDPDLTKQYNVRHILFLTIDDKQKELPQSKQEEIKKKAEAVLQRAQKGEDFSKLAKEYSEDPGSKDKGGQYSFFKGEAVEDFQNAVFKLKNGQISGLVKTIYGYHIIKLESYLIPKGQEMERVKLRIRDTFTEQKRNTYFEGEMNKWKQTAHIEKNEELINSINIFDLK